MGNQESLPHIYKVFTYEVVLAFFRTYVLKSKRFDVKRPFISVGCGLAEYERRLQKDLGITLILVDPDPTSFFQNQPNYTDGKPSKVDYATVPDLLKARPKLVGRCNLILFKSTPNKTRWDYDAVHTLKPRQIIVLYDALGGDNGKLMHAFLDSVHAPNQFENPINKRCGWPKKELETSPLPTHNYVVVKVLQKYVGKPNDGPMHFSSLHHTLLLLND